MSALAQAAPVATAAAPGPASPTVSVVISAYTDERWDDVLEAVASVRAQTLAPLETVVVVDHNPDLLRRLTAALPDAIVIPNGEERGLSGARNTGTRACTAEVVAFLDDDAVAAPDWLQNLLPAYADPLVQGTGGWIAPLWVAGRRRFFPAEFNWVVGCSYTGLPTTRAPVRNLIGANMSFRRSVISEVGGFRTGAGRVGSRPFGHEDTEFCIRIRRHIPGAEVVLDPAASIRHKVPAGRASLGYFVRRCYIEGLSKAELSDVVGTGDGLASERAYTARVLPRGIALGLRDGLTLRDASGFARAGAIALGLGCAAAGYVVGRVGRRG